MYLDKVERAMMATNADRASRRSVVEMVEDQIAEMCRTNLNDHSTDEDFQSMFDQMDSPASFAAAFDSREMEAAPPAPPKKRFSKLAILAGAFPVFSLLFLIIASTGAVPEGPAIVVCLMSLFSPVAGWYALRRISTNEHLVGKRFALAGIYVPLIAVANGLLIDIGVQAQEAVFFMGGALLLVAANVGLVFLIRCAINRAESAKKRSPSNGNGMSGITPTLAT